jgi:hypothetical protein
MILMSKKGCRVQGAGGRGQGAGLKSGATVPVVMVRLFSHARTLQDAECG